MSAAERLLEATTGSAEVRRVLDLALAAAEQSGLGPALVALAEAEALQARATTDLEVPDATTLRNAAPTGRVETSFRGERVRLTVWAAQVDEARVAVIGLAGTSRYADATAWQILLAITRASLLAKDRRRVTEVERLNVTAQRVAGVLDVDEVLSEIVRDAVDLVGADSGDIVLRDRSGPTMRVVAVANLPEDMLGFELAPDEGVSPRAMAAGRTIIVSDYQHYRHRVRRLDSYGFRAVVSAPLVAREEPLGVLNVHTTRGTHRFGRDDARLLTTFANHAAIAIDNARRYENEALLARDLTRANAELGRSLTLQQRLAEQVLLDRGPAAVVRELATLLERPVVLQDEFFRIVAGAAPDDEDGWQDLVLPSEAAGEPVVAAFLRELADSGRASRAPVPPLPGSERLVAPLRSPPGVSGYLVFPSDRRLGDLDRALIEVASTGVALEMSKLRAQVEVESRIRGDVVSDLLSGSYTSPESIVARVSRLGYDLSDAREVIVFALENAADHDDPDAARRRFMEQVELELADRASGAIVASQGELVVALTPVGAGRGGTTPRPIVEGLRDRMARELPTTRFSAAIGDPATVPDDYGPSFQLARQSLAAARKLGRRETVVDAGQLGVARLLIGSSSPEEVTAFAGRRLRPLLGPSEQARNLLETLRTYVDSGFNQRETARRCFVHINTVAYRLRRVEELLGVDLGDAEALMDLTFALRVRDVLGIGTS